MMKHNFKNLEIWKRSRVFVKSVYAQSKHFPKDELFGLTSQLRRSAISIPSNISEGCGRGSNPQLVHFLDIAIGSSCEAETQIILAHDLGYISEIQMNQLTQESSEIRRMIISFQNKFR